MHPAHESFQREIVSRGGLALGEIWIEPDSDGRFWIRHADDRDAPSASLKAHDTAWAAYEIGRRAADGAYRPLKAAATLQRGWLLGPLPAGALAEALENFYPAAVEHREARRAGALVVCSFRECAARQTGLYAVTAKLTDRQVVQTVERCCDSRRCLKAIEWPIDRGGAPMNHGARGMNSPAIPCPEPCSLFMAEARRILKLKTPDPQEG